MNEGDKGWPVFGSVLWHVKMLEHGSDLTFRRDFIHDFGCRARADAWQELQDPKPSHSIPRVFAPAQHTHYVLDVRCFEKLEATPFDKRDFAPCEFDFEQGAVM